MVGLMMMKKVIEIEWDKMEIAIKTLMTIVMMTLK